MGLKEATITSEIKQLQWQEALIPTKIQDSIAPKLFLSLVGDVEENPAGFGNNRRWEKALNPFDDEVRRLITIKLYSGPDVIYYYD